MDKLSMCRICLVEEGLNSIADTVLEELYEKLTTTPFQRDDGRPLQVCYICRAKLQNCYRLQASCVQSEELFTQVLGNYEVTPTLAHYMNTFKIVHPVVHLSCAPVTRETSDVEHSNMDRSGIIDDNVQVKKEQVEVTAVHYDTNNLVIEDIVKTEDDVSSYNTHTREAEYNSPSKYPELSVEVDIEPEGIIKCMESQDELQSDHTTESTEFSEKIYLKPVRMARNRLDLDSIETGTLAAEQLEPDLVKEITQSTTRTGTRYRKFSNKVETMDKTLVDTNIVCKPRQLDKQISDKPYKCDIFEKELWKKSKLRKHIRVQTGKKPYSCDLCKKGFIRKSDLSRHIHVHTKKTYSCDICKICFNDKGRLSSHIGTHTGQKPHSCDICKKGYILKIDLSNHIRLHTGERTYRCDICNKLFYRKSHFSSHNRMHTGEKPYSCDICNKHFSQKYNLSSHIRVHTGEKPYKCNICNKYFNQKSHLSRHSRVHTGEKPYSCNLCEKSFNQKGNLTVHMRVHTGES